MPNFTAYENISITQMLDGLSKKEAVNKAKAMVKGMGLSFDENKKVFEMSVGEKQRVAFIRAITPEFTVLFADEPTGNLDRYNALKLLNILKQTIHKKCKTAIIVSHDMELALEFADEIIVLEMPDEDDKNQYSSVTSDTVFKSR